jgi:tRNA(Ile)-lysidine synthase
MIHILGKIPPRVTLACSGGVDSMAIANFLLAGKRKVTIAYFNHDTSHSKDAEQFIKRFCGQNELNLVIGRVRGTRGKRSLEEFWRDERYEFLNSLGGNFIITGHHLDDVVETWVMSSMHGNSKIIPYRRGEKIYRPFLLTSRKQILDYANSKGLSWVEDPSNSSFAYMRNLVRHKMMPDILKVNPGIRKTIKKKILDQNSNI